MNRAAALLLLLGLATGLAAQPKKEADLEQTVAALKRIGGTPSGFEVMPNAEIQIKVVDKATPAASKTPVFRLAGSDDATLARIPKSEASVGLDLHGYRISDSGLKHVANLRNLQVLVLSRTTITDDGWQNLAGCKNLYVLDLSHTKLSSDALRQLDQFKELRALDLTRCGGATDKGVRDLGLLKELRPLNLAETRISDTGVKELAALKNSSP